MGAGIELKCKLETLVHPASRWKICSSSCFEAFSLLFSSLLQNMKKSVYSIRDLKLHKNHGLYNLYKTVMMTKAHWHAVNIYSWVTIRSCDMWSTCLEKGVSGEWATAAATVLLSSQQWDANNVVAASKPRRFTTAIVFFPFLFYKACIYIFFF